MLLMIGVFILLGFLCTQWKEDWRESLLVSSIIMGGLIFAGTELLSLFGAVSHIGLMVYWAILVTALAVFSFLKRKLWKKPSFKISFSVLHWHDWLLVAGVFVLVLINAVAASQTPPNNWDSMVYHLPRVMHWLSNGNVNHYATHIHRQLFMNPGVEFLHLHLIGLSGGDQWVNFAGILIWMGGAVLASLLAKEFGANERTQWLTGLVCLMIPTSILQAGTPKNDLLLGYWVLASILVGLKFIKKISFINAVLLGGVIGLAILTKSTAYVLLAPLVIWLIVRGFQAAGKKMWQYGVLITLFVAVLAAPQMLRNYDVYGSPLGPGEETDYYHNEIYGLRVLASNSIRNLSMHLRGSAVWSDVMMKGVDWLHNGIGIDSSDPRTTWVGYTYELAPIRFNEDELGAPLHLAFFGLAVVLMLFSKDKKTESYKLLVALVLMLVIAFLLFSGYLRWQLWGARLMMPMIMIASVVIGVVTSKLKPTWLSTAMLVLMLLFGLVGVWKNPTKPLPVLYDFNIFNLKRPLAMIYDLSLQEDYMSAVETFNRDLECNQIGLVTNNADWEYPFWVLLDGDVRIEHILVENQSGILMDEDFEPCAVMVMTSEKPEGVAVPLNEYTSHIFWVTLTAPELNIYIP